MSALRRTRTVGRVAFQLLFVAGACLGCGSEFPATAPGSSSDPGAALVAAPAPAPVASAQRAPQLIDVAVPELRARVNDHAGLLSPDEVRALEAKLQAHEQLTGQQFALLIVRELKGAEVRDFGFTVATRWKLGRAGHDDGVLVTIAVGERQSDIQVGKGLTREIPDELAARVLAEAIAPAFREKRYAVGLGAAFDRLIGAARPAASGR